MYERFTDRARKVMQLANQESQRFNHEYIGTEHILLGLVKEGTGVAANVLKNLDIDLRKIRLEVEKIVQAGPDMVTMGKMPQTPHAKKALEFAIEEARGLNHNYVGTEHLLLGLIRDGDGVAGQVLVNLGVSLIAVRQAITEILSGKKHELLCRERRCYLRTHLKKLRQRLAENKSRKEAGDGLIVEYTLNELVRMIREQIPFQRGLVCPAPAPPSVLAEIRHLAEDEIPGMTTQDRLAKIAALAKGN